MQSPFISIDTIQAALDGLLYSSVAPEPSPLQRLTVVDRWLADPDLPPAARACDIALNDLFVGAIRDTLAYQRAMFGLPPPDNNLTRVQALDALGVDGQAASPELAGWSILFYRYVCVNLNLSVETLASRVITSTIYEPRLVATVF